MRRERKRVQEIRHVVDSQPRIGEKGCRERVRKPEELGEWDGLNENVPPQVRRL